MSETTGPHTCTEHKAWTADNKLYLEEAGSVYAGVDMVIDNPDEEGKGEICMRGTIILT